MTETVKTILHAHPHFLAPLTLKRKFNPLYHIWNADQSLYRLFHPIPSLEAIVSNNFERNYGISAISGCHTPTGGMDLRFWEYMKQCSQLDKNFYIDYNKRQGILFIAKKKPPKEQLPYIILF